MSSLLCPGESRWRIYYDRMLGQLSATCSNLPKQPNGELLVAVDHSQLRTMASETVDPIDWSHPPPSLAVSPWAPRIARCECGLQIARLAAATGARTRVHGYARPYPWSVQYIPVATRVAACAPLGAGTVGNICAPKSTV